MGVFMLIITFRLLGRHGSLVRLAPIMLLNLPIMLFGNASIFPLLCSYCAT